MNAIHKINAINEKELSSNVSDKASWHADYSDTSYIFIGNLHEGIEEKDVLIIFSQYGNPTHINLVRDRETGKSRGFCYLKYEDHRSCILAIDNFNGTLIYEKPLKVDHTYYKLAKGQSEDDFKVEYPDVKQIQKPKLIKNTPKLLPYESSAEQSRNKHERVTKSRVTNEFLDEAVPESSAPAKSTNGDDDFSDPMATLSKDDDFSDPMATLKADDNDFGDPIANFGSVSGSKKSERRHRKGSRKYETAGEKDPRDNKRPRNSNPGEI